MVRLRNLLSDRGKARRNRRILLNMQVSFLAWLLEFIGGLIIVLMIFLPQENDMTRGLNLLTGVFFLIIVPSAYLINGADVKSAIVDSKPYLAFINTFAPNSMNQIVPRERDNSELENEIGS